MGTPTFSSFNDVVRELEDVYGHQELWLYSGLNEDSPSRQPAGVRNGDLQKFSNETAEWWQNNQASLISGCSRVTTICRSLNTALRRGKPASSIRSLKCIVHC